METHELSRVKVNQGLGGQLELASRVLRGQVVTKVIPGDMLNSYLATASRTGFKVEKIAGEGEEFPHLSGKHYDEPYEFYDEPRAKVSNVKVQGKGYIAVSVERPKEAKDNNLFWEKLEKLDQNEVQPHSKPTTKS